MVNYLRNFNTILDNHPPIITEILSTGIKHCLSSSIFAHDGFSKDWKDYFDALIDDFFDIYFALPFAKCISEKGHGEGYRIFRQPFQSLENEYSNVYTRGGLIAPRGYYCPLPNPLCKVGTKCSKKSMEKNAFDYKFWFEKQELVRVEKYHEEYRENDKELVARISDAKQRYAVRNGRKSGKVKILIRRFPYQRASQFKRNPRTTKVVVGIIVLQLGVDNDAIR